MKIKKKIKIANIKIKVWNWFSNKIFRLFAQSAILGFAAYLYILEMLSAGTIIACSILLGRILAPIDQISNFLPLQKKYEKSKTVVEETRTLQAKKMISIILLKVGKCLLISKKLKEKSITNE